MRTLLISLFGLGLAALAVLGLQRFLGPDRPTPSTGAEAPVEDVTARGSRPKASEAASGSRALIEGGEPPANASAGDRETSGGAPEAVEDEREIGFPQVEERFRRQAKFIAEALELTAGDEERLYEVLLSEYKRRAEYFEELRKDAFDPEARARVREELAAIQEWKTQELQAKLGAELAQAVQDFERDTDRGLFQRKFERDSKERSED